MSPTSGHLSDKQLSALLNILVHHETYGEVGSFNGPEGIRKYGYPFVDQSLGDRLSKDDDATLSGTPLLQLLLTRIVLPAPGFRDFPPEFWGVKLKGFMERFGEANLSDSYDKGALGTRKRLACAATVIHEAVTRGLLAGIPRGEKSPDLHQDYDLTTADGITKAYEDAITALVHEDIARDLFDHFSTTADFEAHSPAIRGGMDYAIIHIATLLHYIFVMSAEGPYLVKMIENIHGLIPYNLIRQTLRVGNAATMINGMAKLFLAKMSIGAVTNWFGWTKDASDGMNLMQRIISMVLDWDANDFMKAANSIKESNDRLADEYFDALDRHVQAPKAQQEAARQRSQKEQKSIIIVIFKKAKLTIPKNLTTEQHRQCLDYYAAKLADWDREASTNVMCRQSPDFLTGMVRDALQVFDPMIRSVHDNVDLKKVLSAAENFLNDAIAVAKGQSPNNDQGSNAGEEKPPSKKATVDDYVALLHRHKQSLMFDYLHNLAKSCPEVRDMWCDWLATNIKIFRENYQPGSDLKSGDKDNNSDKNILSTSASKNSKGTKSSGDGGAGAGRISNELQGLFKKAPEQKREKMLAAIDEYADYLEDLEDISKRRMQRLIDATQASSSTAASSEETLGSNNKRAAAGGDNITGPGAYLAMFEDLLNKTLITPDEPAGPPRLGKDVKSELGHGKTEAFTAAAAGGTISSSPSSADNDDAASISSVGSNLNPEAPDIRVVTDTLGAEFQKLVAEISRKGLPGREGS